MSTARRSYLCVTNSYTPQLWPKTPLSKFSTLPPTSRTGTSTSPLNYLIIFLWRTPRVVVRTFPVQNADRNTVSRVLRCMCVATPSWCQYAMNWANMDQAVTMYTHTTNNSTYLSQPTIDDIRRSPTISPTPIVPSTPCIRASPIHSLYPC